MKHIYVLLFVTVALAAMTLAVYEPQVTFAVQENTPSEVLPADIAADEKLVEEESDEEHAQDVAASSASAANTTASSYFTEKDVLKDGMPQTIESLAPSLMPIYEEVQPYLSTPLEQLADNVSASELNEIADNGGVPVSTAVPAITALAQTAGLDTDGGLTTAYSPWWDNLFGVLFIIAGVTLIVLSAVCIAATLGIASVPCIVSLIIGIGAVAYGIWLLNAYDALSGSSQAAITLGENYIEDWENAVTGEGVDNHNALELYNSSLPQDAAMAEAAALQQLGQPWSQAEDAVDSTLAGLLGSFEYAEFSGPKVATATLLTQFVNTSGNPGCGLDVGYGDDEYFQTPTPSGGAADCGAHTLFGTHASGTLYEGQTWALPTCSADSESAAGDGALALFVPNTNQTQAYIDRTGEGNPLYDSTNGAAGYNEYYLWSTDTSAVVRAYNISGGFVATLGTPTVQGYQYNFTLPSGGYEFCTTSDSSVTIGFGDSFPITDETESSYYSGGSQTNPESLIFNGTFYEDGTTTKVSGNLPFNSVGFVVTSDLGVYCGTIYGNATGTPNPVEPYCNSANGGMLDMTYYLYALQQQSVKYGEAYWAFLTYLGYSNANQIPINCVIPTPSSLIPTWVSLQDLEDMSVFQILILYTSLLVELNGTFNNTGYLPGDQTFTLCGITAHEIDCETQFGDAVNQTLAKRLLDGLLPSDPNWWACSFGFSTEAWGYVYLGNGGVVGDNLTDARTWNDLGSPDDGVISLQSQLNGEPIVAPLNQTWLLPSLDVNPTDVSSQQMVNSTTAYSALGSDPYDCIQDNENATLNATRGGPYACEPGKSLLVQVLAHGNSTESNGSSFKSGTSPGGAAVYLVACFAVVDNATIFNVTLNESTSGFCQFKNYQTSWQNTSCNPAINPDCKVCPPGDTGTPGHCSCFVNCNTGNNTYNFCLDFPIVSAFTVYFGNAFAVIPLIGTGLGQVIGCVVGIIVLAVLVVFIIWVGIALIRSSRRGSGGTMHG